MYLQFPQKPEKLTRAEQSLLEFVEGSREEFLFMTIGQLARRTGISEATISRFVRHLGCRDFKQLKHLVMEQNYPDGPVGKMAGTLLGNGPFGVTEYLRQQQKCLEKTLQYMDQKEFERAQEEILRAKKILIHGKSASASMAQLLLFRLRRLGLPVQQIPSGGTEMLEGLVQAEKDDLVILFGFSKISREGKMILQQQKTAGYHTLCFTGRLHLTDGEKADVNLYVYRGESGEYHSMTAAAALVDALVVAVSSKMGVTGAKYLKRIHQLKVAYGKTENI